MRKLSYIVDWQIFCAIRLCALPYDIEIDWCVSKNSICSEEFDMFRRIRYVPKNLICSEEFDMFRRIRYVPTLLLLGKLEQEKPEYEGLQSRWNGIKSRVQNCCNLVLGHIRYFLDLKNVCSNAVSFGHSFKRFVKFKLQYSNWLISDCHWIIST